MRVLLTGGAGFIGRHVRSEFALRDIEAVVLDSLRPDVHGPHPEVPAGLVVGDVRDGEVLDRALVGVDAVVHLAAKVGLGVDTQDFPDYASSNVHGTASLLAAMDRAGVRRLVQASSMVVYGPGLGRCPEHGVVVPAPRRAAELRAGRFDAPCPRCASALLPALVDEDAPLQPRNAYAVSKLAQEQLSLVWAQDTGGSVLNLRYHNVYGRGMPRDTPYAGVAAVFLSALRRGEAPRVFEDGRQERDFVHVRDVAAATVQALCVEVEGAHALNVGSGVPRSVGEFAGALSRATGGPDPQVTGQFRSGDIRHITADSARARTLLDWRPGVEFADGVAELVRD